MAWKGVITNDGSELLTQWTGGKTLTITRAAAGTGRVSEAAMLAQTALVSEKQAASIVSNKTTAQGQRIQLQVTPQTLGYALNQFGVWAKLASGAEKMIALFQTDTDAGVEIPSKESVPDYVYTFYGLLEFSGTGGTLQVTIDPEALATTAAVAEVVRVHSENKGNPHSVTKTQVGLGNVPNVATNDQTPTYTAATTLSTLTSGEKLSVSMGKIMKAITDLISHIGNKSNPHSVTKTQVGLGNVPNVATNDQTPTYTAATTLSTLTSGEKLSVSMGKIMKAITDLISHIGNKSNPHSVTKTQVGLGNVPNVATNDQTPTYTAATTLSTLTSGEKLSVSMGKIMKAITDLISHIGNKSNPHNVTAAQVGALPLTGGILTGNLTGKYITGTWLQATDSDNHMTSAAAKIAILDSSGWVYYRTIAELLADLGIPDATSIRATASAYGTTKLSTSVTSTSKTLAATPYAVKTALDEAKKYTDSAIGDAIAASY